MKKILLGILLSFLSIAASSQQSMVTIHVTVSAVTGADVAGLKVVLANEQYGIEYTPVTLTSSGKATFSNVMCGLNSISVDGSSLGLESYYNNALNVSIDNTEIEIVLQEAVRTPYAVQSTVSHDPFAATNSINLSWNKETDYFFDDFEDYEAFSINFAPWTGYDGDHENAAHIQGTYPNAGIPQYATIFNPLTIDPSLWYDYPVMRPYSGKQYVGFIRTESGVANNDWLISPKISVGVNNIVSFLAKAADVTKERFNVLVSTSGTDISDFVSLTSGNYQTVDYKGWYDISYSLAQYEGQDVYIAIQCVSNAAFMLMIDDFYVGPAELLTTAKRVRRSPSNPNESFHIYLDGSQVATTEDLYCTLNNVSAGNHTIEIEAQYLTTVSPKASINVDVPADDNYASLTANISANASIDNSLATISIVNVATGSSISRQVDVPSSFNVPSLPRGDYLANISCTGFDDSTLNFTLNADKSIDLNLIETLASPVNLSYDSSSHTLSWNRDAGFTEGFEDYEDFTQDLAPWTSIDNDGMPTYAISVEGSTSILTTPETRGKVGAMVFNPYSTKPYVAAEDAYFIAPEGDKYIMFSSAEQAQSDDWLISPLLNIESDYVLRFTAKSYTSLYPGIVQVGVLTQQDNTSSFQLLDALSLPADWSRYELSLADYADSNVQIAFHHVSYDAWISFVDDVYVGHAQEQQVASTQRVVRFDIYADNSLIGSTNDSEFSLKDLSVGQHTIGVQAIYATGSSDIVTITVTISTGINDIETDSDTESIIYYNMQGQIVDAANLSAGIYVARTAATVRKIVIK